MINRLSVVYANWRQYTSVLFWLQSLRFGIAERGKFDNVSYTPFVVAISKSELTEYEI